MEFIEVRTPHGHIHKTSVVSDFNRTDPSFPCLPPHTPRSKQHLSLDLGSIFHESLEEDFHPATDNSPDPGYVNLWLGSNGSQNDDDQARLCPVAWCECSRFQDDGEGGVASREAAAVLLYSWFRSSMESGDRYADRVQVARYEGPGQKGYLGILVVAAENKSIPAGAI